jgi:hypothetical protein
MKMPIFKNIWEAYIQIKNIEERYDIIRFKIVPFINDLKSKNMINWYCFLIHRSRNKNDTNLYFHLRIEFLIEKQTKDTINSILPIFFKKEYTANFLNVEKSNGEISGLNNKLIKDNDYTKAWWILGLQSELILNILNIHKDNIKIQDEQITQFLHFISNMTWL